MAEVRFAKILVGSEDHFARVTGEDAVLLDAAPWAGGRETTTVVPLAAAKLGCPVAPRTIFGIGKNYRAHAAEMGGAVPSEPLVFAKTTSSLIGPDNVVFLPEESARVDYEGELGVVIGTRARRVSVERAMDCVFGYTPICDVTARDLQTKDGQWMRAKGFDTFCPAGPFVVSGIDASDLELSLTVNDVTKQHARTSDMVFDIARLVAHISTFATLEPGDLILTGTPEGIGPLAAGDTVSVAIERLGTLRFRVAREK
jgi:2-keto-4-pentenoate hydratase/2-oxohepta-3-ene-1,7-dioic acid hydratase in catechol pathway